MAWWAWALAGYSTLLIVAGLWSAFERTRGALKRTRSLDVQPVGVEPEPIVSPLIFEGPGS